MGIQVSCHGEPFTKDTCDDTVNTLKFHICMHFLILAPQWSASISVLYLHMNYELYTYVCVQYITRTNLNSYSVPDRDSTKLRIINYIYNYIYAIVHNYVPNYAICFTRPLLSKVILPITTHVGNVQLSCLRGGTMRCSTFFNVSLATHVTTCDVRVTNEKNLQIIHQLLLRRRTSQCNSPTVWFINCSNIERFDHVVVHRSVPSDSASPSNATRQFGVFFVVL